MEQSHITPQINYDEDTLNKLDQFSTSDLDEPTEEISKLDILEYRRRMFGQLTESELEELKSFYQAMEDKQDSEDKDIEDFYLNLDSNHPLYIKSLNIRRLVKRILKRFQKD